MNHAFGLRENKPNQTQPVVSLPALPAVSKVEPSVVEGVEPISKAKNAAEFVERIFAREKQAKHGY